MPDRALRLLILDDSPEDRTVVRFMLEEAAERTWQFLEEEKGAAALHRLGREEVDCILLDYHLPDMNAVRFLRELTERFGTLRFPVVVFTGAGRASLAELALLAGAQDYLSKDMIRADTLVRAIDNSLRQVQILREHRTQRQDLEAANQRLRLLEAALREISAPVVITDAEIKPLGPRIVFVNTAFTALTGYGEGEVIGKHSKILHGPKTSREVLARVRRDLINGRQSSGRIVQYRKDRSEFTVDLSISPVLDPAGLITHFVASQQDVTSHERGRISEPGKAGWAYSRSGERSVFRSSLILRSVAG